MPKSPFEDSDLEVFWPFFSRWRMEKIGTLRASVRPRNSHMKPLQPSPDNSQTGSEKKSNRDLIVASLALVVSILTFGHTVYKDYSDNAEKIKDRADKIKDRSIEEVDRVHGKDFLQALASIADRGERFIEDDKNRLLIGKDRFETFWEDIDSNTDTNMMMITTSLASIQACVESERCDRAEVFSRFPDNVYQAIFFLREFLFLPPAAQQSDPEKEWNGWWLGNDINNFLASYCAWVVEADRRSMTLWSPYHEEIRSKQNGSPIPTPCLSHR